MVSLENSFEYVATPSAPSFRTEKVMLLFCLAGILLFVGGILVGQQLTVTSWSQEETDKTPKEPAVAHGRFGVPRPLPEAVNDTGSIGLIGLRQIQSNPLAGD